MSTPLLTVDCITKRFDGLTAVDNASIVVTEGSITGLIGPNGAGKTTLFAVISGFETPASGSVHFAGRDVTHRPVHQRAIAGIARTFQIVQPFAGLTVRDNIAVGAYLRHASPATLPMATRVHLPTPSWRSSTPSTLSSSCKN